jgi:LytTr DNA-binding domain
MPFVRTLIQSAFLSSAKPERDGWFVPCDERTVAKASGGTPWPSGVDARLSVRAVYAIVVALVAASCLVGTFSAARDVSWRMGVPHNLWEPALWYCTSGVVVVALLPLARRGAMLARGVAARPLAVTVAVISLAFVFSGLHIIGMGVLRGLAYAAGGWTYRYPWSEEIPYELRKDLFSYVCLAVVFWLANRATNTVPAEAAEGNAAAPGSPATPAFWLRDGRMRILIDPHEIVSVSSAGNYVEYALTGGRRHLIRATLRTEEARLSSFGVARVHRTRLVNVKRMVAVRWRPSGDFEVRLDTGEVVVGSRRFKATVAGIV